MARRAGNPFTTRSFRRALGSLTRSAMRAGSRAVAQALRPAPTKRRTALPAKPAPEARAQRDGGLVPGVAGLYKYLLYQPPGRLPGEHLPLVVMLHGCSQDARALSASTGMVRIAARERFCVLYPENGRLSNARGCWNWYDTRTGRAQREALSLAALVEHVCRQYAVDTERVLVAGLSAGAAMSALLGTLRPDLVCGVAMHSGVGPGVAYSQASAWAAMRGRAGAAAAPSVGVPADGPALLVVHGTADAVVAARNGADAARHWAAQLGASAGAPRTLQRGARFPMTTTDYRTRGRVVVTHCAVSGLGHAWSGGAAGQRFSDPRGPDASRLVWAFAQRQFTQVKALA